MKFYLIIILTLGNFYSIKSFGQAAGIVSNNNLVSIPSPQATEIARYGQVPVDLYNGLANVNIPLYQFPVRGIPVNINLSYHAGGVKPNAKGSWVGIGWSLNATGTITRIQNGMLDEYVNESFTSPYDKCGYYWKQNTLNRSDWETPAALVSFLNRVVCQGIYGTTECQAAIPNVNDRLLTDWAPDEFVFNFFGYSGSFWLDHTGNWVARESSGEKFKVELVDVVGPYSYTYPQFPSSPTPNLPKVVPYMIKGFTLTDANGNKFVFGNDANNVELNRSSEGATVLKSNASSWYLKQITTYLDETINFEYERKYPTIALNNSIQSYTATAGTNVTISNNLQILGGVVQDPVYLKTISFNDYLLSITYNESPLAQYSTKALSDGKIKTSYNSDAAYYRFDDGSPVEPTDFKIDKITITNIGNQKNFSFSYYDASVANRVLLKTITEGPIQSSPLTHQFEYYGTFFNTSNSTDNLNSFYTGYLTTQTDHWGFYNGKFPIEVSLLPVVLGNYQTNSNTQFPSQAFLDSYKTNRAPNATAMQIGSLKKITYPTGGYTEFIYQSNIYSKKISLTDYNTVSTGGDLMAGGLRISEIRSYSASAAPPLVKKYYYLNTDGTSSGVLNSRGINYVDSRNGTVIISGVNKPFSYNFFYDASQFPLLNTNGNHVTYSRIEEVVENGSKKVYEFSNHDDTRFIDRSPYSGVQTTDNAIYYMQTNSRQYARSKLLKENNYLLNSSTSLKLDETTFENDNAILNGNLGIRTYSLKAKDIIMTSFHKTGELGMPVTFRQAKIWEPNITSNMYYTNAFRPIQKKVTETRNGVTINQTETYTYNDANNKVKEQTFTDLSNGQTKSAKYYYPNDFPGVPINVSMVSKNMLDPIVMTENYKEVQLLSKSKINYSFFNSNVHILPSDKQSSTYTNTPETDIAFNAYDSKGNLVQATQKNGIVSSYFWDYNNVYPVAKIINSGIIDIAYSSFESDGKGNWIFSGLPISDLVAFTGRKDYALGSGNITVAGLNASKNYIVSYWSKAGSATVNAATATAGISRLGWTYFEHVLPANTVSIEVSGTVIIDELRLFPKDALMTTYTYTPLIGMTSECDMYNRTTYYEYDGLNRLSRIRDQDNNILKMYDYKYKQ